MTVHHYMVDYEDEAGDVHFANDREIASLAEAKRLAARTSKKHGFACAVAFEPSDTPGMFRSVGAVSYSRGLHCGTDGQVR